MNKRTFTEDEKALIQRTMMQGASKDDVALFVATCERTGLDPFARQIMPSSRNVKKDDKWITVWTWLVTIDGLRKIAVDSGDYEGQEGPWWCGKDGTWKEIWTEDKPCFAAKVLVHRRGFRQGLSGIAKYDSYVQRKKDGQPNNVWANLGDHMTAKCAEALALRRAYPNEMAGLYTTDEMEQAEFTVPDEAKPADHRPSEKVPLEALEAHAQLQDRMYTAFKTAGKGDKYDAEAKKWRQRMANDSPEEVVKAMEIFVAKLEDAAKKTSEANPKAAA